MRRRYEYPTRCFIRQLISIHPRSSIRGGWTERLIWTWFILSQTAFFDADTPQEVSGLRTRWTSSKCGATCLACRPCYSRGTDSSLGHRSFSLICRRPINTALRLTLGLCGSDRILLRQPLFFLPHRLVFSAILVSTSSFSVSQQARVTFFLHRGSGS